MIFPQAKRQTGEFACSEDDAKDLQGNQLRMGKTLTEKPGGRSLKDSPKAASKRASRIALIPIIPVQPLRIGTVLTILIVNLAILMNFRDSPLLAIPFFQEAAQKISAFDEHFSLPVAQARSEAFKTFPYVLGTGSSSSDLNQDVEIEAVVVKKDLSKVIAAVVSNTPSYFGQSSSSSSIMRGLVIMDGQNHAIPVKFGINLNTQFTKLRANAMALKADASQSQVAVVYTQDLCSISCNKVRILLRVFDTTSGAQVASVPMNDKFSHRNHLSTFTIAKLDNQMVVFTDTGKVIVAFRVKLTEQNHQQYLAKFDVAAGTGTMYYKFNVGFNQILQFPNWDKSTSPDGVFIGLGYAYGAHPLQGLNPYVMPHIVIHDASKMLMIAEFIDMYACQYCTTETNSKLYPSSPNTIEAVGGLVYDKIVTFFVQFQVVTQIRQDERIDGRTEFNSGSFQKPLILQRYKENMVSIAESILQEGSKKELNRVGNQQTLYKPLDHTELPELLAGSYDTKDDPDSSVWLIKVKNPASNVEKLIASRATLEKVTFISFKHYQSQFASVNKINLDYFIDRPDASKEHFILAANTIRGVGVRDALNQVPLLPTHSMGLIFSAVPDGVSSSHTCYEAPGSHIAGLLDGTAGEITHTAQTMNRFSSYSRNFYAAYAGFFNAPSSLWTKETQVQQLPIPKPEGSIGTIKTSVTGPSSYCAAISGFVPTNNFIQITTDKTLFNSSGLPMPVETDLSQTENGGDDGSSGGGGGDNGDLVIGDKTAPQYGFEHCLAYVWRKNKPTKFSYSGKYYDALRLPAQMIELKESYSFKSEMMPAQATKDPDSSKQINPSIFDKMTTSNKKYAINVPLHPTGRPEYFSNKFEDLEIFRFTKPDVIFQDWRLEGEFLQILLPAEALFADSYMYIVKMKMKEGITGLPDEMVSGFTKKVEVSLEIQPDELLKLIEKNKLSCPKLPVAASARGPSTDTTQLWTAQENLFLLSENNQQVSVRWHHSILAVTCKTTGMNIKLLNPSSWKEVLIFSNTKKVAIGKEADMFSSVSYNGGYRWGPTKRLAYNVEMKMYIRGLMEDEKASDRFSMDQFLLQYTFDNNAHFKDSRKYPREYHRSLIFRTNSKYGALRYIDSRSKSQQMNVIKCGNLEPSNFEEVTKALKAKLVLQPDGSLLLDLKTNQQELELPDIQFCPKSMCGHEICQMRNLSISHQEKIIEFNEDFKRWESTSYVEFQHQFDEGGNHKQVWKFNFDQITEGLSLPVKYVFQSGFKKQIKYNEYAQEFPFKMRVCPAIDCTWKHEGMQQAQLIVGPNMIGTIDLRDFDPDLKGSCPIQYKIFRQLFGVMITVEGPIVTIKINRAWMRAYDGMKGQIMLTAGNCNNQEKKMNIEYVVRFLTRLEAKPFNPEKQNFTFTIGQSPQKTLKKLEYFDELFDWNKDERFYRMNVDVEVLMLKEVPEIDYEEELQEDDPDRELDHVKSEQRKLMCIGSKELCGPDFIDLKSLDAQDPKVDGKTVVSPLQVVSVDNSKDLIIDGGLLRWNSDVIFKVKGSTGGGLYAEQTLNCSFRNSKTPPPYFEEEPPRKVKFKVYLDEIKTFQETHFIFKTSRIASEAGSGINVVVEGADAFPCKCFEYSYIESAQRLVFKIEKRALKIKDNGFFNIKVTLTRDALPHIKRERTIRIEMDVRKKRGQESQVAKIYAERIANQTLNATTSSNQTSNATNSTTNPNVPENKANIVDEKGIILKEEFLFATKVWEQQILEFRANAEPSRIKESKPPKLAVDSISRSGEPTIKFNQKLIVPTSYFEAYSKDHNPSVDRRALAQLRFIDVRRDLFDIQYHFKSDTDVEEMPFEVALLDWTEDEIKFDISFSRPLMVSLGTQLDFLSFKALQPSLFISSVSLEQLPEENLKFKQEIPRQLPRDYDPQNLERMAKIMRALVAFTLIATTAAIWYSPFFKPLFFNIWNIYFILQLVAYLPLFNMAQPANVEVFLELFKSAIDLRFLWVDTYLSMATNGFASLHELIFGERGEDLLEKEPLSFVTELQAYWVLGALGLVAVAVTYVLYREKRQTILFHAYRFKDHYAWNIAFKIFCALYFQTVIVSGTYIAVATSEPGQLSTLEVIFPSLVAVGSIAVVGYLLWVIFDNYRRGEDAFQRVYNDILFQWSIFEWGYDFERAQLSYYYYSMFLLRRWVFAMIPFLVPNLQSARIILLFVVNLWYTVDYFAQGVQANRSRRRLEMFSELIFGILIYHMMGFSSLNTSPESAFDLGFSFIVCTVALILVNVYATLKVALDKYRRMLEAKFKLEAHMKTRNSILWLLANKDKLGGSMSARKYEAFKLKEEENQDFVRESALSFINLINRIQATAASSDKKIAPSLMTNDGEGCFDAENELVKFKDDNSREAIFVNSVSLGIGIQGSASHEDPNIAEGQPVMQTPGNEPTSTPGEPSARKKPKKPKLRGSALTEKKRRIPRSKFQRIVSQAKDLDTIQENEELVASNMDTLLR